MLLCINVLSKKKNDKLLAWYRGSINLYILIPRWVLTLKNTSLWDVSGNETIQYPDMTQKWRYICGTRALNNGLNYRVRRTSFFSKTLQWFIIWWQVQFCKSWSNLASKDSFETLRTSRFQTTSNFENWPRYVGVKNCWLCDFGRG